ncbi:serine protease [Aquincola sp. MAHUQ-54]|uniref:Serine protease n=1 Tax=Aquincola agrisoli TaxID=3119538 RepID=A0AAW9QHQ1_9BURK
MQFIQRAALAAAVAAVLPAWAQGPARGEPPAPAASAGGAPAASAGGQRVYDSARQRLVQVRTLLRSQDSQASVGSGFLVSAAGHFITNYHVVSMMALQPQRYRLVYSTDDGQRGALQLLAVDVVNDLALLRAVDPAPLAVRGVLDFRAAQQPLARGERIFSLGNPLDVGFAVVEGAYNGMVERSFVPTIFFGGSLSSGMSGGPALDDRGRVIGVNVASRRDGEQVSFLVPAAPARALFEGHREAAPVTQPMEGEIARQLLVHQQRLTDAFIARPWRQAGHPRYAIPVPQEDFMRCWGGSTPPGNRGLEFERSDCAMDSRVYIDGSLFTGHLSVRHEAYDGRAIGALRFAERYSGSFRNESFGHKTRQLTAPACREGEVRDGAQGLPLRSVICLRAYRKLPGLYDVSVLAATLDARTSGAQGRFDAHGVSWDNAQRLADHYLKGFTWLPPKPASH